MKTISNNDDAGGMAAVGRNYRAERLRLFVALYVLDNTVLNDTVILSLSLTDIYICFFITLFIFMLIEKMSWILS
nr:MAG: hypothetical protein [Microvirus sp.]